jgi:flagellar capping protein FliD
MGPQVAPDDQAKIEVVGEDVFLLNGGNREPLPNAVVSRSQLLSDLRDSQGEAELPVSLQQIQDWSKYVQTRLAKTEKNGDADVENEIQVLKVRFLHAMRPATRRSSERWPSFIPIPRRMSC